MSHGIRSVCLILMSFSVSPPATAAATDNVLSQLVAAWKSRATWNRAVRATLQIDRDGLSRFSRFQNEWVPRDGEPLNQAELVIDGAQVRFDGLAWSYDEHALGMPPYDYEKYEGDTAELRNDLSTRRFQTALNSRFDDPALEWREPQQFCSVFDGEVRTNSWDANGPQFPRMILLPKPTPFLPREVYFLALQQAGIDLDSLLYQPLILQFRPFEPAFGGVDPSRCSIAGQTVIRGRPCWLLHEKISTRRQVCQRWFFVDPQRDWSVLRCIGDAGTHPHFQLDIDYQLDDQQRWIPSGWSVLRIDSTNRPIQNFARVSVEIRTEPVSDDVDFHVNPPPGAWCIDWAMEQQYIVRPDGTPRWIVELESDIAATYEDLLNSETGQTHAAMRRRTRPILEGLLHRPWLGDAVLIAVGLIVCGSAVSARRFNRHDSRTLSDSGT